MLKILLSAAILFFSFTGEVKALDAEDIKINCTPTASFDVKESAPTKISKSNNLRRETGSAVSADGKFILIKGRVVGENCLPISDVAVKIWQADSNGKSGKDADSNFVGSGLVYTNNLGEFAFLSILPGAEGSKIAPKVNFHISGHSIEDLFTSMYFPERPRNLVDEDLKKLSAEDKDSVTATRESVGGEEVYNFNITVKGSSEHERY